MKFDTVFFLEDGISDSDLMFQGNYLPDLHGKNILLFESSGKTLFSCPATYKGKLRNNPNCIIRTSNDNVQFWKELFAQTKADNIIKVLADTPFLDFSILREMLHQHMDSLAEFTYSENLPQGLMYEIISRELINSLPEIEEQTLPLSQVIKKNINQFEVELFYKNPDIRDTRLSFKSSSLRDKRIMDNIFSLNNRVPRYTELKAIIDGNPEVLFVGPSYLEVELTGRCDLDCIFCYRNHLPSVHEDMELALFKKILGDMREFALPYSICLGGSGEPMMNAHFYEILELCCSETQISTVIVETNGLYADANYKNFLKNPDHKKIRTIINVNGFNEETYSSIHNKNCFIKVHRNILDLVELNTSEDIIHIQIMKINETEPFLDKYYDFWEKIKIPIILQKQNVYLGKLKDRRYSDLSPLERGSCWHLQRDMFILADGRVGFCKQDFNADLSKGDIGKDSAISIFNRYRNDFISDYKKNYLIAPDCKSCDEWYTFNL